MNKIEFCKIVGTLAYDLYDVDDGSDLCYNLIDLDVIDMSTGVEIAARKVAQHSLQS